MPYECYILIELSLCSNIQYVITYFNLYSAGIDFSRQNLTSVDVRI